MSRKPRKPRKRWTEAEIERVREFATRPKAKQLAHELGISVSTLWAIAMRLRRSKPLRVIMQTQNPDQVEAILQDRRAAAAAGHTGMVVACEDLLRRCGVVITDMPDGSVKWRPRA